MHLLKKTFGMIAVLSLIAPAFALAETATGTSTPPATVKTAAMTRMEDKAGQEIDRRVMNLNGLLSRVEGIKNLSASDKTSISTAITNQVNGLTQFKAKIAADADATTLKADVKSITDAYRIYALVLPQVRIIAAADRIVTVAAGMQQLSAKLEARISAAQSAGADMTAAANAYADYNAKLTDAGAQAQAAVNGIATLVPDNGDKTKMAANMTALKAARTAIVTAQKDLAAARRDAAAIIAAVKGHPTTPVAPATATTSAPVATTTAQ